MEGGQVESYLFALALVTLLAILGFGSDLFLGARRIEYLRDVPPGDPRNGPRVSVIVAARNEERGIEAALRSLLEQQYGNCEILVMDDRSTDRTGAILDRLSKDHPNLRVDHIADLPEGWLGKNHALHRGALLATGEFLLFTDADVVMRTEVLSRATAAMSEKRLDHLAVAPEVRMPGVLLNLAFVFFMLGFSLYARPWKAGDPRSPACVGIGAFNMVRRAVYLALGGHEPIAMRPDDDMKLGKLVKKHGYSQGFLDGNGVISVEWYSSFREMLGGMEKNAFAGLDYSLLKTIGISLVLAAAFIWPFFAAFAAHGIVRLLNLAIIGVLLAFSLGGAARAGVHRIHAVGIPLAAVLLLAVLWNSTLKALLRGGIDWRGTHYPLDRLKANRL